MCFSHNTEQTHFAHRKGFTLIELLVVIAIMVAMMALLIPAFTSLNNAGNATQAAYYVEGALDDARAYAMANNTYVWVGFYEQSESQTENAAVAQSGTGRVVISIVASKTGTMIYNPPNTLPLSPVTMTASLMQVNKLIKIDNMHLQTFTAGTGTGTTFSTRPIVSGTPGQIATMLTSGSSGAPFLYPQGSTVTNAQYTFKTAIQFSPRGEARVNEASQALQPLLEIGLQPTHGVVLSATNQNVTVVQITGITGNVKIYRQ